MKITFLGATKMVTGSNFLVEGAGKKFLVDCGMYQGGDRDEMQNHEPFAYDVNEIDFMLLTHAHIDHSGRIPKLYKEGYRNPVITTKATRDLCSIMLPDSGHIQEQEIEWRNRKRMREGKEALPPLYTAQDAIDTMEIFKPVNYDEIIEIDPNIYVRFNDAGHMLGSAIIEIWVKEDGKETKAVFTGDLGNNDIPLLSSPTMIDNCDYLVMESTYGGRLHIRNDEKANLFLNIVSETLDKGGTVVIPSFAVGRTQEILYELNNLKDAQDSEEFKKKYATLMKAPVYVDSPLAISATEVFRENMNLFDDETKEIAKEIVRADALDKVFIATDYFDASINRISAWITGMRSVQKALLYALLEPESLRNLQNEGRFTELMAAQEELKIMPFGDIWREYLNRENVAADYVSEVMDYEKKVLEAR